MRIAEVRRAEDLGPFVQEWSALVQASPDGSFFETPEWLTSWLDAFWAPRPAAFLFAYDGTVLSGFAPFLADDDGDAWCQRTVTLPYHSHFPRVSVVAADGARLRVLDEILAHVVATRPSPRVVLTKVESGTPSCDDIARAAEGRRLSCMHWTEMRMPWIRLSGTWDDYLKTRSSHVRSEMRRKHRKLERAGRVEISVVSRPGADGAAMTDVMEIERRSWKHESSTSFDTEPGVAGFYSALAKRAGDRGWLRVYVMRLDGEPIAHVFGVVHKNEYLALKTSYVESQRALSPGTVLFEHVLRDAFAQGYAALDLLGVESRWKNELATDTRAPVVTCIFSPLSLRCQTCRCYEQAIKPVLRKQLTRLRRARAVASVKEVLDEG